VKSKHVLVAFLIVTATLAIVGLAPGQTNPTMAKWTVLSPAVASKMAERIPLSPRLNTLDGKTIYMVDINWGGTEAAYSVFEEMQAWFAKNMPSAKTVIKIKKGGYETDDPALWKEIAKEGNAAIIGVSG
jgi:hypothetical protein